jgi:hypothetical protein
VHWQTTIPNKMHNIRSHSLHWNTVHFVAYCTLLHVNKHVGSKNARNLTSSWNITSSIFQLNAQYIRYTYLPYTLCVFRCVFYHPGWEHCVTWSQTACLYKAVTQVVLQNLKYTSFKYLVSFSQCLQQYVMHVLVCWVMDRSHTQHTKTQEQRNNRTQGLSRSLHHYRPKHS